MLPFSSPVPMHDQHEPEVERRQRRNGHAEVAARDQDAAVQHRAALAEPAIGDPAAGQRRRYTIEVYEPVDRAGGRRVEAEAARRAAPRS